MATNDSLLFYIRLIKQKHAEVISASDALFRALPTDDPNNKKAVANNMLQAANDLRSLVSNSDVPDWLSNTIAFLSNFVQGSWTGFDLLSNYITVKTPMETHRWAFEDGAETAFDFDSIFENYKKESRLPELFDQIVRTLEDIQNSGAVDSMTMLRALGKVIATIKHSKDGSYFSLNSAWAFLLSFLNNYLWGELSKLPVLGAALEALEKAIRETNDEMFKVHKQIEEEMTRSVESEVKVLATKSQFGFISYNQQGHLLSGPAVRALPNATA